MPWLVVALVGCLIMAKKFVPRSVWNNNPVNIRYSVRNDWVGEVPEIVNKLHDGGFETFFHAVDGYRAAIILLRNYERNNGLKTIRQLLTRFAPHSENPTDNYVNFVASKVGVSPDVQAPIYDDRFIKKMLLAMHHFESKRVWFGGAFVDAAIEKVNAA